MGPREIPRSPTVWVSMKGKMGASTPEKHLSGGCPGNCFSNFGLSQEWVGVSSRLDPQKDGRSR